jgi:outer membrane protein assembly factor BamB
MKRFAPLVSFCLLMALGHPTYGQDWPTYMHDSFRSGVTEAQVELSLKPVWTFKTLCPPSPAWPAPAKQDFFHDHFDLRPVETYDWAFHAIVQADTLYFASSSQDKIYALDAASGKVRWTFVAGGPIHFSPVVSRASSPRFEGGTPSTRVYAGSDDGCVYCLSAGDGSLIWKCHVAPDERLIPGNGRMISLWPVRTGLVVDDGVVYCTAGLFPEQGTYLAALDARTGSVKYRRRIEVSPQGYMLASAQRLYVPTGRTNPAVFSREQGTPEGQLPSAGGAYALLTEDVLVTGPGRGPRVLQGGDVNTKDGIATFSGLRMVVRGPVAYTQSERQLGAFDRVRYLDLSRQRTQLDRTRSEAKKSLEKMQKDQPEVEQTKRQIADLNAQIVRIDAQLKACYLWTVECGHPYAMVMAGSTLLLGGDHAVAAVDSAKGDVVWTDRVDGKAYGLCVANGALYVSTDTGHIHCFRPGAGDESPTVVEEVSTGVYPQDELTKRYEAAADAILQQIPAAKGYCLVLDCGDGRLACELARRSKLKIVGIEADAGAAEKARTLLDRAGLSDRVTIHHVTGGQLPFTSYFANAIVSDGMLRGGRYPDNPDEIMRVLRPYGGVLILAAPGNSARQMRQWGRNLSPQWKVMQHDGLTWGRLRRDALDGSGQWTHQYAEPGNSACSGDTLIKGPLTVQWFGEPGPRDMLDRHHRNIAPLFKDGRLFVPGDCVVFGVDAYNGTVLWRADVPDSRRLGTFLDCGSMAVDDRMLYVAAEDGCHGINVRSGREGRVFALPQLIRDEPHRWGYVAYESSMLFGSGCKREASYRQMSYDDDESLWHRNMKVVTSDYLFAQNRETGDLAWTYRDGVILNPTIAAAAGRIYFVETHSPVALADRVGRLPVKTLFSGGDQYLVALDQKTGRPVFKKKIDVSHFEEPVCLNAARGVLLLSGSRLAGEVIRYYYDAFDVATGAELWHAAHDTELPIDGGHGEYNRQPTLVGDTAYAWPYAYDLRTGKRIDGWKFERRGHGCGGISASAQCLFWRGGNPWMYDLGPQGGPLRLNTVSRPGCWINMIPAGGLVLIPEASSGCTCGFSLQTSVAYIPESSLK